MSVPEEGATRDGVGRQTCCHHGNRQRLGPVAVEPDPPDETTTEAENERTSEGRSPDVSSDRASAAQVVLAQGEGHVLARRGSQRGRTHQGEQLHGRHRDRNVTEDQRPAQATRDEVDQEPCPALRDQSQDTHHPTAPDRLSGGLGQPQHGQGPKQGTRGRGDGDSLSNRQAEASTPAPPHSTNVPAADRLSVVPEHRQPTAVIVLVSGSGTLLQALIDASADPAYGVRIAAVGADRDGIAGLDRARAAGIPSFVCRVADFSSRADWDAALADQLDSYASAFVVSAGFMKLLGPQTLGRHTVVNTHPALLPAFPGAHAVRDALAYGVTLTGTTCHLVDAGVDTGPIIEQHAVAVEPDDTEESLHERIKVIERRMLVDIVGRMAREGYAVSGRAVRIGG
ncbi:MAG: phosphoribosylglycinamide formyltransferase [Actinomycetales bacterium]|nr:phosphoribosylglycinamide formyltransferase [Actinomycetales bacterium]